MAFKATKVKLRKKKNSGGKHSLYLDYYPPILSDKTGEPTRRGFLGFYIFDKPKGQAQKDHNRETLELADQIRQKREIELNKPEIYSLHEKEQLRLRAVGEGDFLSYFKNLSDSRKGDRDNWSNAALSYLTDFAEGRLKFADLNEKFCSDFKTYLLTTKSKRSSSKPLNQNSAALYFTKFKAVLKQAFREGYLPTDLSGKVPNIKPVETHRQFLNQDELDRLAQTDCENEALKRAALFSALTGLRYSDIEKMTWSEIESSGGKHSIRFTQKKTGGTELMPISNQAFTLLGEPKDPTVQMFQGLEYSAYRNKQLYKWLGAAGITKDITFHCFRHTYATLLLSQGTPLITVSKMLGHRDLKTTQLYAKVMDSAKREAAESIKIDFTPKAQ